MNMVLQHAAKILTSNGLITAFLFAGIVFFISNVLTDKLTRGRIHPSAVAIFLYQGSISLLAGVLAPLIGSASVQNEMTCVGSLLIAALAFNMLGVTKIKVMNLVPACLMPIILCHIL